MPEWLERLVTVIICGVILVAVVAAVAAAVAIGDVTLVAVLIGAVISGGFVFFAEFVRSRRKLKERYQEVLGKKRIVACNDFLTLLFDFYREVSPSTRGIEPLRWVNVKSNARNLSDHEIEWGKMIKKRMDETCLFVAKNQLMLGAHLVRAWERKFSVFKGLMIKMGPVPRPDEEPNSLTVTDCLNNLLDSVLSAMKTQLRGIDVDFVSAAERQKLRNKGLGEAENLIKRTKAE